MQKPATSPPDMYSEMETGIRVCILDCGTFLHCTVLGTWLHPAKCCPARARSHPGGAHRLIFLQAWIEYESLFHISRSKARGIHGFSPGFWSHYINFGTTFTWQSASVTCSKSLTEISLLVSLIYLTNPIPSSHISHSSPSHVTCPHQDHMFGAF